MQARALEGIAGSGQPLPYRARIQALFGRHDVSGVTAHVGDEAKQAADDIGADAYATGDRIAFSSSPDLHTAAHEAAHVVQQRGGVQLKDRVGRPGDAYERHADAVADRVAAGQSGEDLLDQMAGGSPTAAVQMQAATARESTTTVAGAPSGSAEPAGITTDGAVAIRPNLMAATGAGGARAGSRAEPPFPRRTLRGVSLDWLRRNKPRGWREVPTRDNEGWIWLDAAGRERLRFMRPNGENPSASQWSRQANGYFRWQDEAGNYLDIDGNVVPPSHPQFNERTHIMYEGP
ncbi:MAG TPA: DUF4157 domain-containing protein [Kofleriaceae bacterium]